MTLMETIAKDVPHDDLVIREATVADTADVVRLFGALHEHNASFDSCFALADDWQSLVRSYLEQSLHSDQSVWLLATRRERVVGFVLVEVHVDSPLFRFRRWAEIVGLYVEPSERGTGVAHLLMAHAYDWASSHGLRRMQLYVSAPNAPARRFYAREGFVPTQLIMRRDLVPNAYQSPEPASRHVPSRLHFSEGGERPLDMHDHQHSGP